MMVQAAFKIRWWKAVVLCLLVPGLGHYFLELRKRGLFFYGLGFVVSLYFFLVGYRWFYGFVCYVGFVPIYYLVCLSDSLWISIRPIKENHPANKFWVYLLIVVVHWGLVIPGMFWVVSPLKPYRVPSDSMARTLIPGDYFLADKRYYNERIPKHGDVVVFALPANHKIIYVKRIVGLAGDVVEIKDGRVILNGVRLDEPYMNKNLNFNRNKKDSLPVTIPEKHIFVMGDNRPRSSDSRQFGSVDVDLIRGKVLYLIWAKDRDRIGLNIDDFSTM